MKIGIISESPLMTTGFGVVCDQFARQLSMRGWDVSCFGVGFTGWVDKVKHPYRIWLSGRDYADFLTDIPLFLAADRPEALLLIGDIQHYVPLWSEQLLREPLAPRPIVAHVVADGLPVSRRYVTALRGLNGTIVATNTLAEHLRQVHGLTTSVVSQGVDINVFRPMAANEKAYLRQSIGLDNIFLVGVFGRNDERKQQPRVLHALRLLSERYGRNDVRVYMHCQTTDDPNLRGWDLSEVAMQEGVADWVIFPRHFYQLSGITRLNRLGEPDGKKVVGINELSYLERLSICDVIVNPAFTGGFELTTLEAQACGVPLAITNDAGNMVEVAGFGASLMEGAFGLWGSGARQYLVNPDTIAQHILHLCDDIVYRQYLIEAGLENARRYSLDVVGEQVHSRLLAMFTTAKDERT